MAYPPLAASRRPRRRTTFALLVVLILTVGVVALALRYRTERRDSVDYLAAAKRMSDQHAVLAAGLADLFTTLGDLERPDILNRLTDLSDESAAGFTELEGTTVTAAVGEANGFFTVAVGSWDRALGALGDAITEVLDGTDEGRTGSVMLADAFEDLRVGDRAYVLFKGSLDRLDPDLVTWEYPDFGYTAGDRSVLYDAPIIADHLRSTLKFVENLDVSVRGTTDPEPLGAEGDVRVVPDSDAFAVHAVVTNEGNVTAELITVSLEISDAESPEPQRRSEIVAVLEPGEATTVLFEGFSLVPGLRYELHLEATVADDDVPDNNAWELVFVRNER